MASLGLKQFYLNRKKKKKKNKNKFLRVYLPAFAHYSCHLT